MSGKFSLDEPELSLSHFQMPAFLCAPCSFFSTSNEQPVCLEAAATVQFAPWPSLAISVPVSSGSAVAPRLDILSCNAKAA